MSETSRTTSKTSIIIRIIISVISGVMLVWSVINTRVTEGTFIGAAGFGAIIAICVFWKPLCRVVRFLWSKIPLRIIMLIFGAVIVLLAGMCAFFTVNMIIRAEVAVDEPEAIIVLGCQVKGEKPSAMLISRMNAALDIYEQNNEALIIACGGQGAGEDISEAEAMRCYFIEKGVPAEQIISEDSSTSTEENIKYAAEILKEREISDGIVLITNEFHQYRAYVFASRYGISAGAHSAKTYPLHLLNYWIREWAGLFYQLIG
ncbi:MAG: YdcF family protein [Oscillospiraceae bacterium]|nr:YdcF family protein [Oscillospiraceae bacterium]